MNSDPFHQPTLSATPESHRYEGDQTTSPTTHQYEHAPHLNPRSCVTCRKRKVRCNKVEPACENCSKAGIDCIYPAPGRAPRKPRKPPDAELLKRLRRLEGVVQGLGAYGPLLRPQIGCVYHLHNVRQARVCCCFSHHSFCRYQLDNIL